MEFKDIVSISGLSGLHQMISSKGNGIIVKSLEDGKSQFVSSRLQGISSLDNIAVFLKNEETTELKTVLNQMKEKEGEVSIPAPNADNKTLQAYFSKILPDHDPERVHVSDMKKMVKWFLILKQHDLIPKIETDTAEEIAVEEEKKAE